MKNLIYVATLFIFMILGIANATTITVYPTFDAQVKNSTASTNYGLNDTLSAYSTVCTTDQRESFLRYAPSIPAGAHVNSFTLNFVVIETAVCCGGCGGANTGIYGITTPCLWSETSITYDTKCVINSSAVQAKSSGGYGSIGQTEFYTALENSSLYNYTINQLAASGFVDYDLSADELQQAYASKEYHNSAYKPTLVVDFVGGNFTGNASSPVNITQLSYPSPFATFGANYSLMVAVHNIGNFTSSYKIGLSIGRNDLGFCNSACYIGGYFDPYTSTNWFGSVTINPDETGIVSLPYRFRPDFFLLGYSYDLRVTVRPIATLDILDNRTISNAVTIVNFPTATSAKIVNVTLSDYNPTVDQTITASIRVMNNGTTEASFPVGFSIGKNGVYCNRDCYADCSTPPNEPPPSPYFCDYVSTDTLHPNQTVTVSRQFRFDQTVFEQGSTYDVVAAVYYFPYASPEQAYDYQFFADIINISDVATKLSAYATGAVATPNIVQIRNVTMGEDQISFDVYIVNNASLTYNYTIGLSIGLWNATDKTTYNVQRPTLIPPCNKLCYTDGLGDWTYALIPPSYSAPVHRSMKVPHYFLENISFDLAVGVWTAPAELYPNPYVGKLISVTYFKGIALVQIPTAAKMSISKTGSEVVGRIFGVDATTAKMFLAVFISLIIGALMGYWTRDGLVTVVIIEVMLLMFSIGQWLPITFLIIEGAIAAFIVATFVSKLGKSQ